jgi:enhancing lycopene biosynthesis protein 2
VSEGSSEGVKVKESPSAEAIVSQQGIQYSILVRHTGQGLVVREVIGRTVLEDNGAAIVTARVADGVGLALSKLEVGVEESRLGQGHGGEGSNGSESVLHFEGW